MLWLFITLVTLIALLFVWTNWSGKRRWAATQALLEREGETLDFRQLLPPTPPEAENLLAIEPLHGIAGMKDKGEQDARQKALGAMAWAGRPPKANGVALGEATDFTDWVTFLRESQFLSLPADSTTPGRDVLAALDTKFPLLRQLAEDSRRAQAMFTPGLREREMPRLLSALSLAHYTAAQNVSRLLNLRAWAAIEAKDGVEASCSILAASRMARACAQEPLLIGFLVGNSQQSALLEPLQAGLRERVFSAESLRELQDALEEDGADHTLLQAMRGELALGVNALQFLEDAAAGRGNAGQEFQDALAGSDIVLRPVYLRALPHGLISHWKCTVIEVEMRHLLQPLKTGGIRAAFQAGDALEREIQEKSNLLLHPDYIMARMIVPAIASASRSALGTQARLRQAQTALALERHAAKHDRYPAGLAELVPEFLSAIPEDPCDGRPMRYRRNQNGRYLLWSVGFDGLDDQGKINADKGEASKLYRPQYLGDWAWQYEPVIP